MDEHRIAQRRRILKPGTIVFIGGIDCTVRNISETGAALEVASPVGIPKDVTLIVEAGVRLFGAKRNALGLRFLNPRMAALYRRPTCEGEVILCWLF